MANLLPVKLYNTLSREVEGINPIQTGEIRFYACGVTPYDHSHIGHGRCYVTFDVFVRFLKAAGYKVKYVRNFTDIDDKIISSAAKAGEEPVAYAAKFIESFTQDMAALGNAKPDEEPRVSTHMDAIIGLIEKLMANDVAYQGQSGDILFDTTKFADYGKLSRKPLDELRAGARVEVSGDKRNSTDFVLWKSAKDNEIAWPSPWGQGRPGWHIECSAMACKHLGESIDIHGGGADLVFPHHENEVAQSEAAHGKCFSRSWMHVAFINFGNEKMSKSLGNFSYLKDMLRDFSGEAIRYYYLQTHYRKPIEFTPEALGAAEAGLQTLYKTILDMPADIQGQASERFMDALADDFNTPKALSILFDDGKKARKGDKQAQTHFKGALALMGLGQMPAEAYLRGDWKQATTDSLTTADIDALVAERDQARQSKDFARSDEIRDQLKEMGIVIEDSANGSTWRRS